MANRPLGAVLNRLRTMLEPADAGATDRELLRRFVARREEAAFGELVRRHGPMVLGVCRRLLGDAHEAEDAFQAVFLVLVRRARCVPWRESLGGWLHGTARRVALRARRSAEVGRRTRRQSADARPPAAAPDPAEESASRELRRVLDQELQGLPARMRAPLVLCDMEGKTHEQAARELGWPKGSLAKRLRGAREQLRARLVRRGVALSAAGLAAVFTVNEVTAAPSAALAAAALLAAEGGASTTAAALAKGVVQAMGLAQIKTAAVLTLLTVMAGAVLGVGAYRALGAHAPTPATANPPPAAEDKDPMPTDKAVVYHVGPVQGVQTDDLPEGAAVVTGRPEDVEGNVQLYLSVFEKVTQQSRPVPVGTHQAILAVGPVLDSPDEAVVAGLAVHGNQVELNMAYTSAVAEGKALKRNVPWRPLVQVPIDLAIGRYDLKVTWRARKTLPAGEAWGAVPYVSVRRFVVTGADLKESKAVRVNGAEFRAFAEAKIGAPAVGGERPVDLGLRITNASDKPLIFHNLARLTLATADGKELRPYSVTDLAAATVRRKPLEIVVDPGKSLTPPLDASLRWAAAGDGLQLDVTDYSGSRWLWDGLKAGKYLLTAEYELEKSPDPTKPFWTGKATTEPVAFEIVVGGGGLNLSKPVRVEGLEFTALAPARIFTPAAGAAAAPLSLRVVNVSDKPITLATFDVIGPRLVAAGGKEWTPDMRRKDTPKITPPVTLAPGDGWIWRPEAGLRWTPAHTALELSGEDGRGVAGAWSIGPLPPGKYRLIVEYASSHAKPDDAAVWVGKAVTAPADFEITAP